MRKVRFAMVLLLLLPAACLNNIEMGPGLDKTSYRFSEAMRWRDYRGAANYIHPDVQAAFYEQFTGDDDLHIVGSRMQSIRLNDAKTALADYQLEYYRLPSNSIKKWHWAQEWELVSEKATRPALWMVRNAPPQLP